MTMKWALAASVALALSGRSRVRTLRASVAAAASDLRAQVSTRVAP
jgi:hypothetical protein